MITLFHEFGHGPAPYADRIDTAGVSGHQRGTVDAVELPSQFMENWCWEPEALAFISGHYEPANRCRRNCWRKCWRRKTTRRRCLFCASWFGLFDFRLHAEFTRSRAQILETLAEIKQQVALIPGPSWGRFPHAFSHIFAGGIRSGLLQLSVGRRPAADAFSRFEEEGIFNRDHRPVVPRQTSLAAAVRKSQWSCSNAIRGREPQLDAMLEHYGIKS